MTVKIQVYYNTAKLGDGFRFVDYKIDNPNYIFMGEIELYNPFAVPDQLTVNVEKLKAINADMKVCQEEIDVLNSKMKDLLRTDYTKKINHE